MLSNHLILCYPLILLPSIFPIIRVFSYEFALCIRWLKYWSYSISSVRLLSRVQLFATPYTAACQAFLFLTIFQSLPKFMSIESVILFNHLILCYPLILCPSIFPNVRVFSNELAPHIRWPKYWSFNFPINIQSQFPLGLTALILQSKGLSGVFSSTTV